MPLSQTSGTSTKPHYSHLFYFVAFSVLTRIEFVLAHRDEEPEFVEWGYGGMGSVNNSSQGAGELIRLLVFLVFWFFGYVFSKSISPVSSFLLFHILLPSPPAPRTSNNSSLFLSTLLPLLPLLPSSNFTNQTTFSPSRLTSLTSRARDGAISHHHDPRSHVLDHARLRVSFTSSPPSHHTLPHSVSPPSP